MIKVLNFHAYHVDPHVDLSSLPNLTLLRIDVSPEEIVISSFLPTSTEYWQQLDRTLATLPISHVPIFELEMPTGEYDRLVPCFSCLSAKKLLQHTDPNDRWFEEFFDMM
ncbi:hypothetical protein C8R44DRAFT_865329 [Mycena epipterygia]|nr:hypothetical protein C8R44DRAFT_865329 [Mycena epipterygia]